MQPLVGGRGNTIQQGASCSTIAGGETNDIEMNSFDATISGGILNSIQSFVFYSAIGGGYSNTIIGWGSFIGGGYFNTIQSESYGSAIGGGYLNTIQTNSWEAVISGGSGNTIQTNSFLSMIGGGEQNIIQNDSRHSVISGGLDNTIQPFAGLSVISGGWLNRIQSGADQSVIAGGNAGTIQTGARESFVGGGYANTIQTNAGGSFIGGISQNTIGANAGSATIPGGANNMAAGNFSFAAGQQAQALHPGAFVWADSQNSPFASSSSNQFLIRAGGGVGIGTAAPESSLHVADASGITLGVSAIAGGYTALKFDLSAASNGYAEVQAIKQSGISYGNLILQASGGSVGIGKNNPATGLDVNGTVTATGFSGNGSGLNGLTAANLTGSVPSASLTSVPAGALTGTLPDARLSANVAWLNGTQTFTGTNTFTGQINFGSTTRQMLNLFTTAYGIGIQNFTEYFRTDQNGTFSWFKGGVHNDSANNPGTGGTELMRLDGSGNLSVHGIMATNISLTSDRNAKENFSPVNVLAVLDKVAALPVSEWNFKTDSGARHIGPMAQDFRAAFNVGEDDKHIAVVDEGGVALAAIQGLNQKVDSENTKLTEELKQKETEITELKQQNETLEKRLDNLEQMVKSNSGKN